MKTSLVTSLTFLLVFFGVPGIFAAQTGYVSDLLFLTFRDAPKETAAVIQRIKSGTPVSIIEEQAEYYKVELESKESGWVDKRFISFDPPKTIIIETLKQEKKALENKILDLESQLQSIKNQISGGENSSVQKILELEASLKTAKDETEKITASLSENKGKYDTLMEQSGDIQKIINENKELQEKNKALSAGLSDIKSKSSGFFEPGMIKWSLFGLGVLLLGWVFGHSVSVNKRRGSSSSLLG